MAPEGPRWPKMAQEDEPERPFGQDAPRNSTTFISEKNLRHLPCEINVVWKRESGISCLTLAEPQFLQDVPREIVMLGKYVDFAREVSKILDVDKSSGFAWDVLKKLPLRPIILGQLGPSWAILGHVGPSSF